MFRRFCVVFPRKNPAHNCWPPHWGRLTFAVLILSFSAVWRGFAGGNCVPAPPGVIGWWAGDGNAGTLIGTNNGTLQGTATATSPGINGACFTFDGTNSFVAISNSAVLQPTNLTIEAWIRFSGLDSSGNSAAGDQYIIFKQNSRSGDFEGFDLGKGRAGGTDYFRFIVSSSSGLSAEIHSATLISTGVWYHVAAVRGPSFTQIYVNGVLEQQTNVSFAQDYGNLPVYFGTTGQSFWDHRFKGSLDEVTIYNRALSSNEIAAIYSAGTTAKCKQPDFSLQPQGQTVGIGGSAFFNVTASGVTPLSYQWRFNGTNLSGATTNTLTVANAQPANAGDYTVVVTNALGSATSAVATLIVITTPSISAQPQSRTNIAGTTATFNVTAGGSPPLSYQWFFFGTPLLSATGSTLTLNNVQPSNAGNYSVVITNSVGSVTSTVATLTVYVPPSFTAQPQSLTNIAGTSATFSAAATGTVPLSYQWRHDGNNLPGATDTILSFAAVQPSDAGNYAVVVTNVGGVITSAVASLTVWVPPGIAGPPQSRTNLAGTTATFNVTASGTGPLNYQWQFNGGNIAGATASTLTLNNVQSNHAGNYSAVVTNSAGSITSAVATLTVWVPPTMSAQPQSRTNIAGTSATFSATASGTTPFSYQWQFNGANIGGATGSSFSIGSVQASDAGNYTVVVTNVGGSITSAVAALTVWVPPSISSQPQSQTNIAGTSATFTVAASGTTPFSYQWQFNGANIGGATASTLTLNNVQPADAGSYSVVVTNFGGSITSALASLTVWVPPTISFQPQSRTNIAGTSATFSATASGTTPFSYQWQFNGANIGGATGSSFSIGSVQASDAGNYSVVVTNVGGSITSAVAALTVWVPPTISSQPQSRTNLAGTAASFFVTVSGTAPLSFQWQFNGTALPGATGSNLSLANVQPSDAGAYSVMVTNFGGSVTSAAASLVVWVPPSFQSQPQGSTNIFGTSVSFSASATGTLPLSYHWRFNGTDLPGATSNSLAFASVDYTNSGNYTLVVTNVGGSATSSAATLLVIEPQTVLVCDPNLEAAVRREVGKPAGALNRADFRGLTSLRAYDAHIASLCGLEWATNLTSLYLGGNVINDLSPLTNFTSLRTLFLYNNRLTDLSSIAGLTNLSYLDVRANAGISNFASVIPQLRGLTNLFLGNNGLSNITFVAGMGGLKFLGLDHNLLTDLSPLAGLTNLAGLDLSYNALTNLAQVPAIASTNLVTLHLSGNAVTNINPLAGLTSLKELFAYNLHLADLSPVSGLTNLSSLNIGANPDLASYSALGSLTSLSTLWIEENGLSAVNFLAPLAQLILLDVDHNRIQDVAPLGGLSGLKRLSAAANQLTNISPLSGLSNLLSINLSTNSISDMSPIAALPNLKDARVRNNAITIIPPLSTSLDSLDAGQNPLADISALGLVTTLSQVRLDNTGLTNIVALQALVNLNSLDLGDNSIADIAPLLPLNKLATLKLPRNLISAPAVLAGSVQLLSLDLSFNPAPTWNFVSKLTNLTELALQGNGLTNTDFLRSLTNLATLDLSGNRLTNCEFVTNLAAVHSFMAGNNRLVDLSPLRLLGQLWTTDLRTNLLDLSPESAASAVINDLSNRFVAVYSLPQNQAPSISIASYWPVAANATSPPLVFTVQDDVTQAGQVIVTATSSNSNIIPNSGILIGVSNSTRTLVVTPTPNQTGNDVITVTATDDTGLSTNTYVLVSVVPAQAISIPDPNLRSAIRSALGKPSGALSNVDMLLLNELSANSAGISNLTGLEWASNLVSLSLSGNYITNLQPLSWLSRLESLSLDANLLFDGSPLSGLTGLHSLQMNNNPLTNIAFLQSMFSLNVLNLENDYLADLAPLAALTNVNSLFLKQNLITNIFAVQNLPNLSAIDLSYNLLDLSAGTGANSVIQALQARAVAVIYLPQRPPPAMSLPATWAIPSGTFSILPFTVTDALFPASTLSVSVVSSNQALLPDANLLLHSDGLGNWTLRAVPAQPDSGSFPVTFRAKNPAGLTATQDVLVFVVTPAPFAGEAISNSNLQWNTWGFNNWFIETNVTHYGVSAAQSGPISDTQESWLGTVITGPGRLSYWWKVSSEPRFDWLELYINGVLQSNRISGEVDWQMQTVNVPPGTNSFRWRYAKDRDTSDGLDAGWLADVSFTPGVWLEIAGPPTNGRVTLMVHAVPGATYELQVSSNLVTWTPASLITPVNNATIVIDSAATTAPRYYRLHQLSAGTIFFDPPSVISNKIKLVLRSPPALRFDIQTSTNLVSWNQLMTVTNISGNFAFTNVLATNIPRVFYRAKLLF